MTGALEVYAAGLTAGRSARLRLRLRIGAGQARPLPVERWLGPTDAIDDDVLGRARGATIDLGCGPGRHTAALTRRGIFALGVDISPAAVALASERGAQALTGSLFDSLPGAGHWSTALLLDGNVGIGGSPVKLLRRVAELLRVGGELLIELESPATVTESLEARIEIGEFVSDAFPWSRVSVADIGGLGAETGFGVAERWSSGGRWFARLTRLAVGGGAAAGAGAGAGAGESFAEDPGT